MGWEMGRDGAGRGTNFKYLGFVFNNNGSYTDHIKNLISTVK